MNSKLISGILFGILLLVVMACGGGGSTGGGGGTVPKGPFTSVRMEAVLEGTSPLIDATNIFVGETVRFRLTGIDEGYASRPRLVLPGIVFTSAGSVGGNLESDGLFSAPSVPTGGSGTVNTVWSGIGFSMTTRVVSPQARLIGRTRLNTGLTAARLQIQCLDSSGNILATGLTTADGTIRMSTPPTATKFTFNFSIADPDSLYYVRQFKYNSVDYSTVVSGCVATLPTLAPGTSSSLASEVIVYASGSSSPPPPPDGCS